MKVYETIDVVRNHRTGAVDTMHKVKPVGPTRGRIKVELFNEDGTLDTSANINNIAMDWMDDYAYWAMYNQALIYDFGASSSAPTSSIGVSFPTPLRYLSLTDWDKPEHKDTPGICGNLLATAMTGYLYSGNSTTQGTYNNAESSRRINSDGQLIQSYVYDWPTHAANGTFQSLWLSTNDRTSTVTRRGSYKDWYMLADWPSDLLTYVRSNGNSNSNYTYSRPVDRNYSIVDGKVTVWVTPNYGYSPSPYYAPGLIYQFDAATGRYLSHVTTNSFTRTPSIYATPIPSADGGYFIVDITMATTACYLWKIDGEGNEVDYYELAYSSFTDDNDNALSATLGSSTNYWRYAGFQASKKKALFTLRSKVDSKYYNYLIEYDLETKEHKKTFLNPIVNPYLPASRRDTVAISGWEYGWTDNYIYLVYWTSSSNSYTVGTFTAANHDKMIFLSSSNMKTYTSLYCGDSYISSSYLGYSWYPCFTPPTTHTLLPAPITKTSTHTMKITYEIIVDLIPFKFTSGNFIDHLNAR